jgi:hypothetical protein
MYILPLLSNELINEIALVLPSDRHLAKSGWSVKPMGLGAFKSTQTPL